MTVMTFDEAFAQIMAVEKKLKALKVRICDSSHSIKNEEPEEKFKSLLIEYDSLLERRKDLLAYVRAANGLAFLDSMPPVEFIARLKMEKRKNELFSRLRLSYPGTFCYNQLNAPVYEKQSEDLSDAIAAKTLQLQELNCKEPA